jgi:Zn-dependent peptidase ImmA (M78 family)
MLFFLDQISELRCGWNKKPLSEETFHRLCKRRRITVVEMPLRTNGFYYCVKGRHYIAIDAKLKRFDKLFVMFHEFAHYLMHAPDTGTTANFHGVGKRTRKEREADAFALCALIPRKWIEERAAEELHDEEGIPLAILKERREIYEMYRI